MAKNKSSNSIMRLIGNKNTVTLLGIAACVAILIVGYSYRVKVAISPISVPYAKQTIKSRTLITSDMIGNVKVSKTYADDIDNLVRTSQEVIGKYVSYKTNIPEGSLFYTDQLKTADEMPDAAINNIPDGYTLYSLAVDADSTFANQIRANNKIDIYMKAVVREQGNKVLYGAFITSIQVLAVRDNRGNNILKNSLAYGVPSELLFAVDNETYKLLKEIEFIGDIELVPVVRNKEYSETQEDMKIKEELRNYVKSYTDSLR